MFGASYMDNCYSTGIVNSTAGVSGGLIGANYGNITNCYSNVSVNATGLGVGGLVGASVGNITNCYATGNITSTSSRVGGLVGRNSNNGYIYNSFSTGSVSGSGTAQTASLVGDNDAPVVNSYYNNHSGNPDLCFGTGSSSSSGCTAIDNNESYFQDDVYPGTSPMSSWSFFSIWQEKTSDFPVLTWQSLGSDLNSGPSTSYIVIITGTGYNKTTDNLNCYATPYDNEDSTLTAWIQWWKNDSLQYTYNTTGLSNGSLNLVSTLTSGNTTTNDEWRCSVKMYDGTGNQSSWSNASIYIRSIVNNVQIKLKLNTSNTVYIPGTGEVLSTAVTNTTYSSPPSYYLSSDSSNSLKALVFSYQTPVHLKLSKGASSYHTLETSQYITNAKSFLVFTKGDWRTVDSKMGIVKDGSFMQNIEPSFGYGLGLYYRIKLITNYDSINITGNFTASRGTYNFIFENTGNINNKNIINIRRI